MTGTTFDMLLAGVLFFSMLVGVLRGFLREAVSLLVWVGGLIAIFYSLGLVAAYLKPLLGASLLRYGVAFCLLFFALLCISFFCNLAVSYFFDKVGILFVDKLLGLLFGLIRAICINVSVLLVLSMTPIKGDAFYLESQLVPYFFPVVTWVKKQLPEKTTQLQTWIDERLDDNSALSSEKGIEEKN